MEQRTQKSNSGRDIVYFSRFKSDENGNGGDKRVAQLCNALDSLDIEVISIYDVSSKFPIKLKNVFKNASNPFHKLLLYIHKQVVTNFKYHLWSQITRMNVYSWHSITRLFCSSLANIKPRLILMDDPVFLTPLAHYALKNNIPMVAFCHNIETLSREQVENKHQAELFGYEMKLLTKSSLVVTISREETVLLKNLGVHPIFFPYYPPAATEYRMKRIREQRLHSTKQDYLIFGTVHNPPTMQGMKNLINELSMSSRVNDDRFLIAGYGTESLKDFVFSPKFIVKGSVANAELDTILTEIKACIIYQENGSGALTKIPEVLLAGVPVIINSHAARSHYNLPGIFEFETFGQLSELMEVGAINDQFPQVLSRPDKSLLLKRITELIN